MKTTGDALFQAILDDPDADDLRLIYADWLQDHGEPDRAEFIRLEIRMRPLMLNEDTAPNEWDSPEYHRLSARLDELIEQHNDEWFGPINRFVSHFSTSRGFVEYADTTARNFAQQADEILAAAPLLSRMYLDRFGQNMPAVAARPELASIRELGFFETTLGDAGLARLVASPHLQSLRSLILMDNRIGPSGGRALARSTHLPLLERIDLSDNPLFDDGAQALLESTERSALRAVNFFNCGLGDDFALDLAIEGPSLLSLELGHNHLTALGAITLADSERLSSLRTLSLFGNPLGDGVRDLAQSPYLRSLRELHLGWVRATDSGLATLLRSTLLASVEDLSLAGNAFGFAAVAALSESEMLSHLKTLNLNDCQLSPQEMVSVSRARIPAMLKLDLSANAIGPLGMAHLLASSLLAGVRELELKNCELGDNGAEAIAHADVLGNVRLLRLSNNAIRERGGLALARSPHLQNLARLYLDGSPLSKKARQALIARFGESVCRF